MKIWVVSPVPEAPFGTPMEDDILRLDAAASQKTEVVCHYVDTAPRSIEGEYEDALAVPGTVAAAIQAEKDGADAIVINCTADTALDACRECVSVPVVAPTIAAVHLAAELAHKYSVLTFSEGTFVRFEKMAWRWGFWHKFASVRSVEIPQADIEIGDSQLVDELFNIGKICVEKDGAHALVMGCTAFEIVSQPLRDRFTDAKIPVLVIEPYLVAFRQAELLVSMGISHSKLTYPIPSIMH
jgi:allantoin racemase